VKKLIKILFGLLLPALGLCKNSFAQLHKNVNDYASNITIRNGVYQLDSNAILNNHNLAQLITILQQTDLKEKHQVSDIPPAIKKFLNQFLGNLSMADPESAWQASDEITGDLIEKKEYDPKTGDTVIHIMPQLPIRQLAYLGIDKNIALLAYYTGGIGQAEHIIIFKIQNNDIKGLWCGVILAELTTQTSILEYIKQNISNKEKLNSNYISF